MNEITIPKQVSDLIDDQIEAYPLTHIDREANREEYKMFAEFGYRLAASQQLCGILWRKADDLPEKSGKYIVKFNDCNDGGTAWNDGDNWYWNISDKDSLIENCDFEWLDESKPILVGDAYENASLQRAKHRFITRLLAGIERKLKLKEKRPPKFLNRYFISDIVEEAFKKYDEEEGRLNNLLKDKAL